jgi:hypothetical protein
MTSTLQEIKTLLDLRKRIITGEVGIPKALRQFYDNRRIPLVVSQKRRDTIKDLQNIVNLNIVNLPNCRDRMAHSWRALPEVS